MEIHQFNQSPTNPTTIMKIRNTIAIVAAFCAAAASLPAQDAKKTKLKSADELLQAWDPPLTRSGKAPEPKIVKRTTTAPGAIVENYKKITSAATRGGGKDRFRGIEVVPAGDGGGGGTTVTVPVDENSGVSFDNILFKIDTDVLLDDNSRNQVKIIAEVMNKKPDFTFLVEGHTCDLGSDNHNKSLSEKRAARIVEELKKLGVSPERLLPLGYGETSPSVTNDSEEHRQQNRRVTIYKRV